MYGTLANLITLLHGLVCLLVLVGALAALSGRLRRHPRFEAAFYLLAFIVALFEYGQCGCPMTGWENELRNLEEPGSGYAGSFIGHYLPWLDMALYSRFVGALFAGAFLAFPFWRWVDRWSAREHQRAGGQRV